RTALFLTRGKTRPSILPNSIGICCNGMSLRRGDRPFDFSRQDLSQVSKNWNQFFLGGRHMTTFSDTFLNEAKAVIDRLDPGAIEASVQTLAQTRERGGRLF